MALALTSTVPTSLYTHFRLTSQVFIPPVKSICGQVSHTVRCNIGVNPKTSNEKIVRRSANWQPPIWDYDYVQSLNSKYVGHKYVTRATKLKEDVKKMLTEVVDPLDGLEIIDDLQRLGVFYHFEDEIKRVLESIYNSKRDGNEDGLHATSLKFRLLRQHGYNVPQDVFENFMDETGHFKASLCEDIRGMLYLYEASFLSFSGESIMEEAKDFATKNLEQYLKRKDSDQDLASLVSHALELPLHWRLPRRSMTVVNAMITTIDDVYDVYGTLDELEIFTDAIERWDISAMEQLPDYMKISFLALFNSINEIGYETLKVQDAHIIPHLQKVWADLCKTYLNEAKWYYSGYTPTLEEYMSNAWISIGAPTMLTHEEDARDHIKYLIGKTWEKMNEERLIDSPFSKILVEIAMNIARVSQCMYQYGDGHGAQGQVTKDRVLSLFINPIPLEY
ncbi:hypothetical protein C3L33_02096, partial [Rhododendron williamsianum]